MARVARHLFLSGRVQGVGFRWHCRSAASAAGVDGWVRNLPDGRVEVWIEGPPEAVERMHAWLARGPSGARVTGLDEAPAAPEVLAGFEIRRDY
jgi:acylphosphatase